MVQFALSEGGSPDYQRAIRHRLSYALELFGAGKQRRRAHRRAGLAKGRLIRIYQAQVQKPKVAHGAGRSAYVERIARPYHNDAQSVAFSRSRQDYLFYDVAKKSLRAVLARSQEPAARS